MFSIDNFTLSGVTNFCSLSCQYAHTTGGLNLLLGSAGEELGLHNHSLSGDGAIAQNLEIARASDVNHRELVSGSVSKGLLGDERQETINLGNQPIRQNEQVGGKKRRTLMVGLWYWFFW